jgi:uncharacterized integral membrane protein
MTETGPPGSPEPPPRPEARPRNEARSWVIVIALALVVAYVIWFAVDNATSVSIHWVFGTTHSSLIWVILVSLTLGVIAGLLVAWLSGRRRRSAKRENR